MDKAKLLNIFLLAGLMTLALQFFIPKTPQNGAIVQSIYLQTEKENITIPNIPIVEVINQSSETLVINPCSDMKITVNSLPLTGIQESMPKFCTNLTVMSGSKGLLPLRELYTVFASTEGKYILTLSGSSGERMVTFNMESPSAIRTMLSRVVYQPIYNFFVALITFLPGHSLGWAIIIITLIIRLILLVPQNHMLQSQKKLQLLQPKIKKLQEEYKWDQATLGMKMLELYKKEGVNPMSSIVPLLIQMPILIGLYWVITEINDPSNFYHLYSFFKNFNPTEISTNFYGVHLDGVGGIIGLIMAIMLGFIQWVQAKLSFAYQVKVPKKDAVIVQEKKDDTAPDFALDPEMMQKMMLYFFPLMIAGTSYFFPHGVWLYWFIGTLFVIAQQFYVNQKK